MPSIGLAEAARLTGRHVTTIHRALKTGRLSYSLTATGERRIQIAELERVFGLKSAPVGELDEVNGVSLRSAASPLRRNSVQRSEIAALQRLLDERDAAIRDLRTGLDDLRRRLDDSENERRRVQERLTALLTHRQSGSAPAVPIGRPWWRRWLR